jgi:glucuronoarabinoxylan endo-1,4-beta-xylanase
MSSPAGGSGGGGGAGTGNGGNGGGAGAPTGVTVQLDKTHQTIQGFGLNTALSSNAVPWDTFFKSDGAGLGLSIVRVAMDEKGKLNGVIPPSSYNAKVIASPWTADKSCKDNNDTEKGGHLLTSCYDSWSTTIASFAKSNNLYAMGAANEPDFASCGASIGPPCNGDYPSMVFTAKEMVDFVNVLGPKLKTAGVKLLAPEPSEWLHLWSNTSATGSTVSGHVNSSDPLKCGCFANDPVTTGCASTCDQGNGYDYGHWLAKDPTAWGFVDIVGTHEYDTQKALGWPADVDGGKRSKEVWETEASGVLYWPEAGPTGDIGNGIAVAQWIHSALVVGEASAWLWWWYQATSSNDNEGLVLQGSSALTMRCYTLGNYSKFVRPGYVMVEVAGNSDANVLLSAFKGSDAMVVVAINKGTTAASVPISITGGTAPSSCTPNVTSANAKLEAGNAVPVTGGTFTAALGGTSVTSFVCK